MHLLGFIYSLAAGGAERVTVNLANYWTNRGWQVTIVTLTGKEKDFYELDPRVRRIVLDLDRDSPNTLTAIKHNFQRIQALRNVLKQVQPDIALGMMSTANCLLSLAAQGTGIPAVGSERIHPPMLPIGRVWEWTRRYTYPRLSAVIAQTRQSANWITAETGARQVRVIPNPVVYPMNIHEPRIDPVASKGSDRSSHLLLAAGRLVPQKGFDRLIAAFARLAPRLTGWRLVIAGEGVERTSLEEQAVALGVSDMVQFPGTVGNMGEWYEAADLFVMTSRYEGFPNALCEALAYGVPVVSVDCETGPRDVILNEVNGLLVPEDDPGALVEALERLMENEQLRHRLATHSVAIRDKLSLQRVAGEWERLFSEIIEYGC